MKKTVLLHLAAGAIICLAFMFCGGLAVSAASFSDVSAGDWYCDDVTALAEAGVLGGYGDGCFHPSRSISCAEFTKVLMGCVEASAPTPCEVPLFEGHWASDFISRAYAVGIITDEDIRLGFSPDLPLTRSQMTRMTVRALGIEPAYIESPFIDSTDPYAVAAYRAYLLRGYERVDGKRVANGGAVATRAEAAAVAVRILEYARDSYEYKKNAILENAAGSYLDTRAELADLFYVLNRELMTEYTFLTHLPFEEWASVYSDTKYLHFEYFYSDDIICNYIPGNNVFTVKLKYSEPMSVLKKRHSETEAAADAVIASVIGESMTDAEKLRAMHDYIVLNCAYDNASLRNEAIPAESYLAWGVLCNKSAVCQGYTNAFSLLCKRAGIPCITVVGTSSVKGGEHAWNVVLADGVLYGVDTMLDDTYPDREGVADDTYFMIPLDDMSRLGYSWDLSKVKDEYFH